MQEQKQSEHANHHRTCKPSQHANNHNMQTITEHANHHNMQTITTCKPSQNMQTITEHANHHSTCTIQSFVCTYLGSNYNSLFGFCVATGNQLSYQVNDSSRNLLTLVSLQNNVAISCGESREGFVEDNQDPVVGLSLLLELHRTGHALSSFCGGGRGKEGVLQQIKDARHNIERSRTTDESREYSKGPEDGECTCDYDMVMVMVTVMVMVVVMVTVMVMMMVMVTVMVMVIVMVTVMVMVVVMVTVMAMVILVICVISARRHHT